MSILSVTLNNQSTSIVNIKIPVELMLSAAVLVLQYLIILNHNSIHLPDATTIGVPIPE